MSSQRSPGKSPAATYRGGRSYAFPRDALGRPTLPTFAALDKTGDPDVKLATASHLADIIQIQADSAIRAGSTGRLADFVFRAGQVLDALDDVVETLTEASEPDVADLALKPRRRPLAGVMAILHDTLSRITALVPAADQTTAASVAFRLHLLDIRATKLAARAGLSWRTFLVGDPQAIPGASPQAPTAALDVVA